MNAFHVIGGLTAIFAFAISMYAIRKPDFPGSAEKGVAAAFIVLVLASIGAAVITAATEEEEEPEGEAAALVR